MESYNKELHRAIIIQHYDEPLNKIEETKTISGYKSFHNKSASCIDDLTVFLKIENNIVSDAKFCGVGCAISTASTDILCDLLKNQNIATANKILLNYYHMIKNEEQFDVNLLGELIAFINTHNQTNRIKCALIGAEAFKKILGEENE